MICVSIAEANFEKCLALVQQFELTEIRLDAANYTPTQIRELFRQGNKTIATCRPGKLSEFERLEALTVAVQSGARYLDIEYDASDDYRKLLIREAASKACTLIVSWHDFEQTPSQEELEQILGHCYDLGADVAKLACQVNNQGDLVRLLSLYNQPGRKIVLGMGQKGSFTRLAAGLMGAEFTFASPAIGKETAPGQLSYTEMKEYFGRFQ